MALKATQDKKVYLLPSRYFEISQICRFTFGNKIGFCRASYPACVMRTKSIIMGNIVMARHAICSPKREAHHEQL